MRLLAAVYFPPQHLRSSLVRVALMIDPLRLCQVVLMWECLRGLTILLFFLVLLLIRLVRRPRVYFTLQVTLVVKFSVVPSPIHPIGQPVGLVCPLGLLGRLVRCSGPGLLLQGHRLLDLVTVNMVWMDYGRCEMKPLMWRRPRRFPAAMAIDGLAEWVFSPRLARVMATRASGKMLDWAAMIGRGQAMMIGLLLMCLGPTRQWLPAEPAMGIMRRPTIPMSVQFLLSPVIPTGIVKLQRLRAALQRTY